jgi:REP element-mobilizing transposase RayT
MKTVRRRSNIPHTTRPEVSGPCHVVLRICRGLPWLRTPKTYRVLERCFRKCKEKKGFAIVEYSVQGDHLHLIVEASNRRKLTRGVQGLAICVAKALNRFWRRKIGRVFDDRYFARALATVKQVQRALRYVLLNARKHGTWKSADRPDPFSSGPWVARWNGSEDLRRPLRRPPVARASHVWLLVLGYRFLSLADVPGKRDWDAEEPGESMLAS